MKVLLYKAGQGEQELWGANPLATVGSDYHGMGGGEAGVGRGASRHKERKGNFWNLMRAGHGGGAAAGKYIPKQAGISLSSHSPIS